MQCYIQKKFWGHWFQLGVLRGPQLSECNVNTLTGFNVFLLCNVCKHFLTLFDGKRFFFISLMWFFQRILKNSIINSILCTFFYQQQYILLTFQPLCICTFSDLVQFYFYNQTQEGSQLKLKIYKKKENSPLDHFRRHFFGWPQQFLCGKMAWQTVRQPWWHHGEVVITTLHKSWEKSCS